MSTLIKTSLILTATALGIVSYLLASLASDPYETTKLRNSLLAKVGKLSDFYWTPDKPPEGYRMEYASIPPEITRVVTEVLEYSVSRSEFDKSILLGRQLLEGPGPGGGGILSNTIAAYDAILSGNRGYCADYTQVMNGLAYAAKIPIREWGMSFDGFGGNGHAFSEIYDRNMKQWIFIDTFYGFFVHDSEDARPLSVLEFRERLLDNKHSSIVVEIIDADQFGFENTEMALHYYSGGADQIYLWFGNDVFSYDNNPVVNLLSPVSRALEQGAAILLGVHPEIRLIQSETNRPLVEHLFLLKRTLLISFSILGVLGLSFMINIFLLLKNRSKQRTKAQHVDEGNM